MMGRIQHKYVCAVYEYNKNSKTNRLYRFVQKKYAYVIHVCIVTAEIRCHDLLIFSQRINRKSKTTHMTKRKYGPKAQEEVEKAMHAFKKGKLKTSHGRTVKNRKQAVAIGLSEAREKGAKVPKKK